jgi:predicted alpha/beta hydrolase
MAKPSVRCARLDRVAAFAPHLEPPDAPAQACAAVATVCGIRKRSGKLEAWRANARLCIVGRIAVRWPQKRWTKKSPLL